MEPHVFRISNMIELSIFLSLGAYKYVSRECHCERTYSRYLSWASIICWKATAYCSSGLS